MPRLSGVKAVYDPNNVFSFPQSIPVYVPSCHSFTLCLPPCTRKAAMLQLQRLLLSRVEQGPSIQLKPGGAHPRPIRRAVYPSADY